MLTNQTALLLCFQKLCISLLALTLFQGTVLAELSTEEQHYRWKSLDEDGLHDPTNPSLYQKQNPAEALSTLPRDPSGNKVNWVRAIEDGDINPRTSIDGANNKVQPVLDMDVILDHTADMPMVRFPHKPHTQWLNCSNCHDWLFKQKARATNFGMFDILTGEFCGRCHAAVAFPLTSCDRCHSVYRTPDGQRPQTSRRNIRERNAFKGYVR